MQSKRLLALAGRAHLSYFVLFVCLFFYYCLFVRGKEMQKNCVAVALSAAMFGH